MTLRTIQAGRGDRRDVVVVYHLDPAAAPIQDRVRAAAGADAVVLNETGPAFTQHYARTGVGGLTPLGEFVRQAQHDLGFGAVGRVVLVGYSEGCQALRAHLLDGADPDAVVAIDGTHGSLPPNEATQVRPWRDYAERGQRGERVFVASHTCIDTEHLGAKSYASTRHKLRLITGYALGDVGDDRAPRVSGPRTCEVWSYNGVDAEAHRQQGQHVLPELLGRALDALGAHVLGATEEEAPATQPSPDSTRDPRLTLGERLVRWYAREHAAGTREIPPGSNTSPRIREFLAPCTRRTAGPIADVPLHLTAGAWCCASYCFGAAACALPGEAYPAPRAAGVELVEDAKETGRWLDVAEVRAGGRQPELGDAAVFRRAGPDWARHVAAYAGAAEGAPRLFSTWGGNEGDRVAQTPHSLDEPELLGFRMLRRR